MMIVTGGATGCGGLLMIVTEEGAACDGGALAPSGPIEFAEKPAPPIAKRAVQPCAVQMPSASMPQLSPATQRRLESCLAI